jgi:hypothetical protein
VGIVDGRDDRITYYTFPAAASPPRGRGEGSFGARAKQLHWRMDQY